MPNGSITTVHRIKSITIIDSTVMIMVNSFTDETSTLISWQETHELPSGIFDGSLISIHDWLVDATGPFSGGTITQDETPIEIAKSKAYSTINAIRKQIVGGGCPTAFGTVDTDDISIRNVQGSVQAATIKNMLAEPFSIVFRMKDNTDVTLDANQTISMGMTVMAFIEQCYKRSWELKLQVDTAFNANNIEALNTINLYSNWPSNTIYTPPE